MASGPCLHFEVKRDDLHACRVVEDAVPALHERQVLLRVDAFGLTSNNITYAAFGETMRYWEFFPAARGWGRIPVWGFADAVASTHEDLPEGSRVYGYLPMSTHLVVAPDRADGRGFIDVTPHRASLPPAYNSYQHAGAGLASDSRREAQRMLLWPLFFTSFLLDSYLADGEFWRAGTIVLSSASSKTALGTSFLLAERDGVEVVGLTSGGHAAFVESLGTYDRVVSYDEIASLALQRAVYVDLAGNSEVRGAVHHHYGDDLAFSLLVGGTHWDHTGGGPADLPGPAPAFFFAPDQIRKRAEGTGQDELEAELGAAWTRFVEWTDRWFTVVRGNGADEVERVYLDHLEGRTDASTGHVLSMWS